MTDYTLRTPSQRYDRYTAQMQRLKTLLDFLRRYRALLMAVGVIILAAAVCFLLAVGSFSGEAKCGDFLYGETPACGLKAFLSEVRYQYAPADGEGIWSDTPPTEPGPCRVRAVSKNVFGKECFSEEMTANLLPRALTVRVSDAGYLYGDFSEALAAEHTVAEGLLLGDRLANVKYTVQGSEQTGYQVDIAQLQVLDASGADVTACYIPKTEGGSFTMEPRPVTITADSHEKVYDAMVWDAATAKITDGTLVFDDRLSISFGEFPTKAGSYPIEPLCRILDAEGNDISFCYHMTIVPGTLKISCRPITVTTGSAEKVYDEKPLTNTKWSILNGEPVPGHTLSGHTTGSRTNQGSSENTITLMMTDEKGKDVTDNYSFTVEAGTLTVHPIVLRFGSDSYDRVYDGEAMWGGKGWHISGSVLSGHHFAFSSNVWPKDAGTYKNTMEVFVYNSAGEDVTAKGYKIEVECGTLIIRKRSITITSGSAEKLYDGTPLRCMEWNLTAGTMPNNYVGEGVRTTNFTGEQTEVGSSPNYFTVRITNRLGEDTTHNYQISYEYGTLTVRENPNPPQQNGNNGNENGSTGNANGSQSALLGDPTKGTTVGFPGEPSNEVLAIIQNVKGLSNSSKFYFRYTSYGNYNGSGWDPVKDQQCGTMPPLLYVGRGLQDDGWRTVNMTIQRLNDCPMLSPYFLTNFSFYLSYSDSYIKNGELTYDATCCVENSYRKLTDVKVTSYETQQELVYRQYVRECYLQIESQTKQQLLNWAREQGINADSPTLVTDIQQAVQNAAVYNIHGKDYPAGVDVAVHFLLKAKEGVCQHFATAATMLYRAFGIPARYTVGFAATVEPNGETRLTARDAHAWVEIYVDGLGWVPIEVTGSRIETPQQEKIELALQPYGATKYYDGKTFEKYDLEQYAIVRGQLKEGHRLEVTYRTNQYTAEPGTYLNMILSCRVYDRQGKDVSDQYRFTCFAGELKILKRQITVATGSASKPFDGSTLCCGDYWIAAGSLAPNERLVVTLDSSITHPGKKKNTATEYRIEREVRPGVWTTVTAFYDISWLCGYLEITAPINNGE